MSLITNKTKKAKAETVEENTLLQGVQKRAPKEKLVSVKELKRTCEESLRKDQWNAMIVKKFSELKKEQPELWLIELLNAEAQVTSKNYLILYRLIKQMIQDKKEKELLQSGKTKN